MFSYAALVWWQRVKLQSCSTKLNKLQRMACRAITGAMSTSPTLALESILSLPPLDIFIVGVASSAAYRLNCYDSWSVRGSEVGHCKIWGLAKSHTPQLEMTNDYSNAVSSACISYNIRIPTKEWWTSDECNRTMKDAIVFYSDGSMSDKGAGYGVYAPKLDIERHGYLGLNVTVFQTELIAVLHSLIEAQEAVILHKDLIFCTDNEAVIKALRSTSSRSKLIQECMYRLEQLANSNMVTVCWVPGHSEIEGNLRADELAHLGASCKFVGPEPVVPILFKQGKRLISDCVKNLHSARWVNATSCRQAKMFLKAPSKNLSRFILGLSKRDTRDLVSVLTGHGSFKAHLNRMGRVNDSICDFCLESDDDSEHYVCECPAFVSVRKLFLSCAFLSRDQISSVPWRDLLKFIRNTKRFE